MQRSLLTTAALGATLAIALVAQAADHIDSPAAVNDPAADLTDLFAWMTDDASTLTMAIGTVPFATEEAAFSDAVTYAFHVNSSAGYGMDQIETLVTCQFYAADGLECWVGEEYVAGDPSDPAGIVNDDGTFRVYAGLRNDPFFFELTGFQTAVATVTTVAGDLEFDGSGCPILDEETAGTVVGQLQGDGDPSNTLAGADVLALVVEVDKSLVTPGGPVLGVWASTHAAE